MWEGPRVINHYFGGVSTMLTSASFFFFLHPTWAMAESSYAWVSVAVKRGPTTIHPRKIVKMGWENKFSELLVAVDPGLADTPISKICISSNDKFVDPVHRSGHHCTPIGKQCFKVSLRLYTVASLKTRLLKMTRISNLGRNMQ